MKYKLWLFVCLCLPLFASAQLPGQPDIAIITSPTVPEPNEPVTVSLDAYTLDTTGATIVWYVDGVERTDARNLRSIPLVAGALGESTTVSVRLTLSNGAVIAKQKAVTPGQLDIILEGDTITPGFYKGRPLLSVGAQARAVAIPAFGDNRRPEDFTYLWKLNNAVLYGGPVTGRNYATFPLGLGRNQILSVDVIDSTGTVAKKTIGLPLSEPEIHFYPLNPLRGVSAKALISPYPLIGEEMTVRAEPYYMSRNIFSTNPHLEWQIDNQTVVNDVQNPLELTLRRATGQSGSASVSFHIRNLQQLVQGVEESFRLTF